MTGAKSERLEERTLSAKKFHAPPRTTRYVVLPFAASCVADALVSYPSSHHSHALPCISRNPHWFAGRLPHATVLVASKLACCLVMPAPNEYAVVGPARHAYSHSATSF